MNDEKVMIQMDVTILIVIVENSDNTDKNHNGNDCTKEINNDLVTIKLLS